MTGSGNANRPDSAGLADPIIAISPRAPAYLFAAVVRRVYDGDTITVDIDLGFGVWLHGQTLRLYGIDTPEVRGVERPRGLEVRDWVRERLPIGSEILVETIKGKAKGKYGRWLATVFFGRAYRENLNAELVRRGMAEVNYYR